ncbi:MAG: hypothetical protein MZV63_15215 [Marinilabiliales bacterium]|nr:hypothetical protein [Marinilabiliales bacterium]
MLTGNMTLANGYGSISVSVEEYKRPKFEVTFKPAEKSYKLNDKVTVTGLALAYAGYAIDNADVKYRVVRVCISRTAGIGGDTLSYRIWRSPTARSRPTAPALSM